MEDPRAWLIILGIIIGLLIVIVRIALTILVAIPFLLFFLISFVLQLISIVSILCLVCLVFFGCPYYVLKMAHKTHLVILEKSHFKKITSMIFVSCCVVFGFSSALYFKATEQIKPLSELVSIIVFLSLIINVIYISCLIYDQIRETRNKHREREGLIDC